MQSFERGGIICDLCGRMRGIPDETTDTQPARPPDTYERRIKRANCLLAVPEQDAVV